jgi:hypothetical protein
MVPVIGRGQSERRACIRDMTLPRQTAGPDVYIFVFTDARSNNRSPVLSDHVDSTVL